MGIRISLSHQVKTSLSYYFNQYRCNSILKELIFLAWENIFMASLIKEKEGAAWLYGDVRM